MELEPTIYCARGEHATITHSLGTYDNSLHYTHFYDEYISSWLLTWHYW
jgi:hypothetical protein